MYIHSHLLLTATLAMYSISYKQMELPRTAAAAKSSSRLIKKDAHRNRHTKKFKSNANRHSVSPEKSSSADVGLLLYKYQDGEEEAGEHHQKGGTRSSIGNIEAKDVGLKTVRMLYNEDLCFDVYNHSQVLTAFFFHINRWTFLVLQWLNPQGDS